MGTVFTLAGWAVALLLGEITASCLVRIFIARFTRGHGVTVPDYGLMLPELAGSGLLADLALLGIHPLLTALAAAALFAVAGLPAFNTMRLGRKQGKEKAAARHVGGVLRLLLQTARYLPARDLRALAGLLRRLRPAAPAGPGESGGYRPAPGSLRAVPSILKDVGLGPVPHPAAVAADLEARGVAVHSTWGALAEREASFEAEDEDDLLAHVAETAAGFLTLAEALQAQAETLAAGNGLDPDYIAGQFEFADLVADAASAAAMLGRRYHDVYAAPREHVDAGGTLPRDAREWFGAAGADPDGGHAA